MAGGGGGEEAGSFEYTPTWIVAIVCSVIVFISLALERILHYLGKRWKKTNQKSLFEALLKVKEELMLLGFISLLLTVFQGPISHMCISERFVNNMLPCEKKQSSETGHYQISGFSHTLGSKRRVLVGGGSTNHCALKASFFKQFYGSVTKSDYCTLRLGFIMTHCPGSPKFNFYQYMVRALEADFKKVVGISWYLWIFVIIFLLLNVGGWHTYFWIAFVPLILLLSLGTKLEHVIAKLAQDVADKHIAIEGDLVVQPSDNYFWFHRPRLVLYLIHFILFQNAFEIAFFFWILTTYGFDSCIMGQVRFIAPRLIIGVIIQCLCSYSTLPLYAIVTQMGSSFKKAIFDENVRDSIFKWATNAKKRTGFKPHGKEVEGNSRNTNGGTGPSQDIQMQRVATLPLLRDER